MINRVIFVGRLTRDPELKKTNSGTAVTSFSIAVDNAMKNADGTRGTCFLNCSIFNQQADNVAKYTRKGSLVGVEGRLNQRNFVRKDGSNGTAIEVVCDSVKFLEPKAANASATDSSNNDIQDVSFDDESNGLDSLELPDDDLPF